MIGKTNFPVSWEDFIKKGRGGHNTRGPLLWLSRCIGEGEDLRGPQVSGLESDAYVKVVLQGFWSGSITGGEAMVVLKGVFVSQKLLCSSPRVCQLTSDGTEFL